MGTFREGETDAGFATAKVDRRKARKQLPVTEERKKFPLVALVGQRARRIRAIFPRTQLFCDTAAALRYNVASRVMVCFGVDESDFRSRLRKRTGFWVSTAKLKIRG